MDYWVPILCRCCVRCLIYYRNHHGPRPCFLGAYTLVERYKQNTIKYIVHHMIHMLRRKQSLAKRQWDRVRDAVLNIMLLLVERRLAFAECILVGTARPTHDIQLQQVAGSRCWQTTSPGQGCLPSPVFVHKVLLEHSNSCLFTYCLWLFSYDNGRVELCMYNTTLYVSHRKFADLWIRESWNIMHRQLQIAMGTDPKFYGKDSVSFPSSVKGIVPSSTQFS